jgi:glycosyltransferase involved in cell wall biosynthesis
VTHLPKITVVTPSFNQSRYIAATIESVLSQEYPNLEYIIMDGGSTDGSAEIIARYEQSLAYWQTGPDGGQTDALIRGFQRGTGEIHCWLCSDDLFTPNALKEVGSYFAAHAETQAIFGDGYWIGADGKFLGPKREHSFSKFVWLHHQNYIPQPSTFWRLGLYEAVGGLDPRFDLAMDADLWIRFSERTDLVHVPRTWSLIRNYPEQKNRRLRSQSDIEDQLIRHRYLGSQTPMQRAIKTLCSRGVRVAHKLAAGCYWGKPPALPEITT